LLERRERTIPHFLDRKVEANAAAIALRATDRELTYAEMLSQSLSVGTGLVELGVGRGDHVAVMMRNSLDFHLVWFGVNLIGAVEVPVNTEYRADGLAYILNDSRARVIVVDAEFLDRLAVIAGHLLHLELVVVRGTGALDTTWRQVGWADVAAVTPDDSVRAVVDPGDLAAVMYTSGTTGPPKGVMLPHGCPIMWAEETARHLRFQPGATHYCCFPMFHTLAQYFATMPALANDGTLALGERFSVSGFWDEVRRFGAGSANMMGSTVSLLNAAPARDDDAATPLTLAFGAPAPASIMPEFERRFGLQFVEIYGSSEANVVLWNTPGDAEPGTCGRPIGRFDVRLVDDNDDEVGDGDIGEIITRPHEPHSMMSGYYGLPDVTAAAFRNLWFHTGDLARRRPDGVYSFVDRKKDAIRRRGENISSWEIETVLNGHPAVAEALAFGVPSEFSEEDVMVVLVPKTPDEPPAFADLITYCEARMPGYMVPRYWEFTGDVPRTQTGKVEKYKVRSRGVTSDTIDRDRLVHRSVDAESGAVPNEAFEARREPDRDHESETTRVTNGVER
jgi:crotonobetaine/carnitine-CoA ligase